MVRYSVLGSGSCGNGYIFSYDGRSILVDAGFSFRQLSLKVEDAGIPMQSVEALLLTHLHPDHNKGAGVFARKTGLPVYVNSKCIRYASVEYAAMNIPQQCRMHFVEGERFNVGPFQVCAFDTSHDSAGSVGYEISCPDGTFVVATDTGLYTPGMVEAASRASVLFLESNYDDDMLRHGPYPLYLQKRISGERGHLSNSQARGFLLECGYDKSSKPVYLIHLSHNNNSPELVSQAMEGLNAFVCERGVQYCGQLP